MKKDGRGEKWRNKVGREIKRKELNDEGEREKGGNRRKFKSRKD